MAAYHWEARRKQIIMEHRLRLMQESRIPEESEQQVSKENIQNCTIPLGSNMTSQNLPAKEINQERCLCQTEHVPSQSGKLLKRYKNSAHNLPDPFHSRSLAEVLNAPRSLEKSSSSIKNNDKTMFVSLLDPRRHQMGKYQVLYKN